MCGKSSERPTPGLTMRWLARVNGAATVALLDATSWLGRRLPGAKHRFPMRTTFRHCLLLNYSMSEATLAALLPHGLRPDVIDTPRDGKRAFLSVVIADLEAMRPGFLPRTVGSDFTQVVYRAIVRAPNGERGVYFVRSDADSLLMSAAGNIASNFHFHLARCGWVGRGDLATAASEVLEMASSTGVARSPLKAREWLPAAEVEAEISSIQQISNRRRSSSRRPILRGTRHAHFLLEPLATTTTPDEPASIAVSFDLGSASLTMPKGSAFAGLDVREAQRYFVELYAAFASWPVFDQWSAVRIDRTNWQVVSLEPGSLDSWCVDFMERSAAFPPGVATLDSCFYVHALDYHWHSVDRQPFRVSSETAVASMDGAATFFYDGQCPVCVREVSHWRGLLAKCGSGTAVTVVFEDISGGELGLLAHEFGVTLEEAMSRAHAIDGSGQLRTGIAAFTTVWDFLPYWRWVAMLMRVPLALPAAEIAYSAWAHMRPLLRRRGPGGEHEPPTHFARSAQPGASCRYVPRQKR